MTPSNPLKIIILGQANSTRSIIAEYLLRWKCHGRFVVQSAGIKPAVSIHPLTVWVLRERYGINAGDARPKSRDEFAGTRFDGAITICDKDQEIVPAWPEAPLLANWGCPDPTAMPGSEPVCRRAFLNVASQLSAQIDLLCSLSSRKSSTAHSRDQVRRLATSRS